MHVLAKGGKLKTRILVVDDDKSIADSLCTILKSAGYQAIAKYSGEDALAAFDLFASDLVIADVVMPGMSGIELCTQLRDRCQTCMVLLSGNVMPEELLNQGRANLLDAVTSDRCSRSRLGLRGEREPF